MKKSRYSTYFKILLIPLFLVPAKAQILNQNREERCEGPVFSSREVSRRTTITARPNPEMTKEALEHGVHGRVVLEAVLCRTSRVTDLQVLVSLPYGMTEKAVEAVRQMKFIPAEKDWHTVSQRIRFEFHFNDRGVDPIDAQDAEGRNVESIEIVGNRRITDNEIISLIQTRPGDLCSVQQMKKDLARILATGYFDSRGTRIQTERLASGGVVIIFEVQELPLISEIKFEGLKGVDESVIFEALRKEEIDVRMGGVYDPAKVKRAIRIIRNVLASNNQPDAVIEIRTDQTTATSVVLTFVISGK